MPKSVTTSGSQARPRNASWKSAIRSPLSAVAVGRKATRGRGMPLSSSSSSSSFEPALSTPPPPMARMWPLTWASVDSTADALRLRLRPGLRRRRARAAGRQGDRAGGDDGARCPRPGGLHDHHRRVPRVHDVERRAARRARGRGGRAHRLARGQGGQAVRRPGRPAARLRSLGRRSLDARDDGHDPQSRPQRRGGRGAREDHRQRALRVRLLPPADPDVRRGRRRRRGAPLRAGAHGPEGGARREAGRRAHGRPTWPS